MVAFVTISGYNFINMARYSHLSNKLIILFGTTAAVLIFLSCVLFVSAADQIVMERVERAAPEAASKKASAGRSAAQEMVSGLIKRVMSIITIL